MGHASDLDDRSTILQRRFDPTPPSDDAFTLTLVEGPERGAVHGVHATDPPQLIGTSSVCAIRLGDREVSRRHASLEVVGNELRIIDLGSKNGTYVERVRIDSARLSGGEHVRIGSSVLRVEHATVFEARHVPVDVAFGRMLGASRQMRRLYPLCARLAVSELPIVIEGETGTGKEILAESIHERSPRAPGPFVVLDCSAVSAHLMEAELFGHEEGAFPGATSARAGLFEQARGGTLFIDEIGDLDLALQPKLLRALDRREIRRLGGSGTVSIDVRILAATRRDLDQKVQDGTFRDDLFHRLAVSRIALPPLRERTGDVAVLADHFWKALGGDERELGNALLARWEAQPWPGNVRELRNAVARQLAVGELTDDERPSIAAGVDFVDAVVRAGLPLVRGRAVVVEEYERRYVLRVLEEHGGSIVQAARASGIARRHFQRIKARVKKP